MAEAKARKGDLVLVETVTRNHWSMAAIQEARAAGRELSAEDTDYRFGVVASATRDGQAKSWFQVGYGDETISDCAQTLRPGQRCWVLSHRSIDVTGVLTAAKAHHWPNHPESPMPFASLDEAKNLARPFAMTTG